MILNDNETKIDLLNNEAIAHTIIKLLCEQPDKPMTIGVHGDWGAGKSSILEMIENGFLDKSDILCIKFNGWRFQGFEDAKVALIEGIVTGLLEKRPALTKTKGVVKEIFKRIDWLKVAKKGGGLAWTAFTGLPSFEQIESVTSIVKGWLSKPEENKEKIESVMGELNGLIKPAEAKHVVEEIQEFRKAFNELLKEASISQLIVLIDDLDRCLPDTAIETLEAIRLFLFSERTAFVVAADEAMIEYAVRKHFPDLPDSSGPKDYARNYLEKLIQVPFRLTALGETETRIYISLLLIGAALGEDDSDFQKLISIARESFKRPWTATALDLATVKKVFGDRSNTLQESLLLSDQIGPMLATGTKGNPRQIKRFINTILLRKRIAEARGFGDDVNLGVLSKLMLAERFHSTLFDHIANSSVTAANGKSEDLILLESSLQDRKEKTKTKTRSKSSDNNQNDKTENTIVSGWLNSEIICSWASIQPSLSSVDLRPYLFVAKERKDYFAGTTAFGKLASTVERLFGPKIIVQGMIDELKNLPISEAAQLFEEIRIRIMGYQEIKNQPTGIDGLIAIVTAHQDLLSNLLDFLEGLPSDRIGAWVVSGWDSVLKGPEFISRFENLLVKWSKSTDKMLSTTAAATIATRKKKNK